MCCNVLLTTPFTFLLITITLLDAVPIKAFVEKASCTANRRNSLVGPPRSTAPSLEPNSSANLTDRGREGSNLDRDILAIPSSKTWLRRTLIRFFATSGSDGRPSIFNEMCSLRMLSAVSLWFPSLHQTREYYN